MLRRDYATSTTGKTLQLYANSATGDDGNNGLSSGTAVQTFEKVLTLVPSTLTDHVVINLSGTFTLTSRIYFKVDTLNGKHIIVDGGADLTVVSGTFTATSSTTESVTVSGAGWTTDEHAGLFINPKAPSSEAGNLRMITRNTADTVYVSAPWDNAPGNNDFDVARPTSTITAASLQYILGAFTYIQRLTIGGSVSLYICESDHVNATVLSHVVHTGDQEIGVRSGSLNTNAYRQDISNPGQVLTSSKVGLGYRGTATNSINIHTRSIGTLWNSALRKPVRCGSNAYLGVSYGSRVDGILVTLGGTAVIDVPVGWATPYINGVGHAIEINTGQLNITGVIDGYAAAGAGVYAHGGSVITMKDGSPPTLTGTVGDISTDGTTEAISWSAVDAGSIYSDVNEQTLIKEVA